MILRIKALVLCFILSSSAFANNSSVEESMPDYLLKSLETNYYKTLPVLSAVEMVLSAESPEEREYAFKFLKYKVDKLSSISRVSFLQMIKLLEDKEYHPVIKGIIEQVIVKYPHAATMANKGREAIKAKLKEDLDASITDDDY